MIFWNFRSGLRPDGSLSPIGMAACDAYAKKWVTTGQRAAKLEARHPELADRFAEIRAGDGELLEFHLIDTPPSGPGIALPFPGVRPIANPPHEPVADLLKQDDGSYALMFNSVYTWTKDLEYLDELVAPVETVRWLKVGERRFPGTVIIDACGDVYVTSDEWNRVSDAGRNSRGRG